MQPQKVAIVTGANKGLGLSIVKKLCQQYKGKVYLTSRDTNRGIEACEKLQKLGINPTFHQLDVSDENSVQNFIKTIRENNEFVDILVNNAGVLLTDPNKPKFQQAEQMMEINFFALVNFTESLMPYLRGTIVNISSSSGHLSRIPSEELKRKFLEVDSLIELKDLMRSYLVDLKRGKEVEWGTNSYVVTKVGVNRYTFMLHRRLASKGISVNCIHPGYVMSDMTGGKGNVTPDDAADVVVKLALQRSSSGQYIWSNGTAVPWDGPDPRAFIDGRQ